MIAVVDYGMGNLRSVAKALERAGAQVKVTSDAAEITGAQGVVLPGVGAFGACMDNLRARGLLAPVRSVIERGVPFFGICLGMQLLFEESEEFGPIAGLGILPGRVVRFPDRPDLPVPHMGWNTLRLRSPAPHLRGIEDGTFMYFVHSYFVVPKDPSIVAATTEYGLEFAAAVWAGNVFATQFHPEKSQRAGLQLLRNFLECVVKSR